MSNPDQPLVTVLTPVYNGAQFIRTCIESVMAQSYQNYEHIIVNNCSTDGTLEIAQEYARKDSRIRVHDNTDFVAVIANHNIAFNQMSPKAKYCKMVSADDFIFPQCIARMVEFCEANPSVGILGSYQLSGDHIRWQGFAYPQAVFPGIEMGRKVFLGTDKSFGFGTPSSTMYRADLVRRTKEFYPNDSPHADTSACFQYLRESDYGFLYEVLSFEKTHEETQSWRSAQINRYSSALLNDITTYGPDYLNQEELQAQTQIFLKDYYRFLAINYFVRKRDKEFWKYHKSRLEQLGNPLKRSQLYKAAVVKVLPEVLNPGQALSKLWKYVGPKPKPAKVRAAVQPSSQASKAS